MTKQPAHSQKRQHVKDIALLFSIPTGIMLALGAFLYVPRFFANPAYDFIYCEGYSCSDAYSVTPSGTIATSDTTTYRRANLYYYDVSRDSTRPLHVDEASRYQIDANSKSPDGYVLKDTPASGGFLFFGIYNDGWALQKGIVSKPVDGEVRDSGEFIGWVLQNG